MESFFNNLSFDLVPITKIMISAGTPKVKCARSAVGQIIVKKKITEIVKIIKLRLSDTLCFMNVIML